MYIKKYIKAAEVCANFGALRRIITRIYHQTTKSKIPNTLTKLKQKKQKEQQKKKEK